VIDMARYLKILVVIVVLSAAQGYANSEDIARIHDLNPILDREEIIKLASKVKQETDTRQIYGADSPEFLETYGKLMINGTLRGTGNVVVHNERAASVIVTTAAHCFHGDEAETAQITIEFTKRDGTVVQRALTPYKINAEDDYAILKLDRPIANSLIKPLLIADYAYDQVMDTDYYMMNPYSITYAGYNADSGKGNGGNNLTYDQDCRMTGRGDRWLVNTDCVAYPGASGGAFVITVTDEDNNNRVTDYFVGVNHSISVNNFAEERPQVACFVDHSAMYDDLLSALGESQ